MSVCQLFLINHFHGTKVSETGASNSVHKHNIIAENIM